MATAYTLGDLLEEPELGVELVVGSEEARQRPISGAHSIEVDHPSRWLDRDWLMLTTGVRLRQKGAAQRELVAELDGVGAAAIGFGVGDVFKNVPSAMVDEARARDFPIVHVPFPTPFRAVIGAVYRATLSGDLRSFQRLTAMHRYLTDALSHERPLETLIERLGQLLDATVAVLGPTGEVESATGSLPAKAVWHEIKRRPSTLLELDVDDWHCVAAPVKAQAGDGGRWLVVASRGEGFANNLTKAAAQATTPLLTALGKLDLVTRDQARAVGAAILDSMLESTDPVEQRSLATRSASLGIDFRQPAKVVLVQPRHDAPRPATAQIGELGDRLQRRLEESHLPHLATAHDDVLCLLIQGDDGILRELLAELISGKPEMVAGFGRGVDSPERVATSFHDAQLAVQRLSDERNGQFLDFEDFDLVTLVASTASAEWTSPKIDQMLAPLRDNERLLETVRAYFEHDLDVGRAAESLQLHPNSMRYRLGRVELLLGRSLRQPATIASLYLALLAGSDRAAGKDLET